MILRTNASAPGWALRLMVTMPDSPSQPDACSPSDATFRLDVQQVLVPVVVTDKKGHHVTGFTRPISGSLKTACSRTIASFSSDTAGSVDDIAALSKPIRRRRRSRATATFVICIDTLHASPASAARMREALENSFR